MYIEKGVYVSITKTKGQHYGGILINSRQSPIACNVIRLDLIGRGATGWFDKIGHIFQLEVAGVKVCEYDDIVERQKNKKLLIYFSLVAFFIFGFFQFGLFKFYQLIKVKCIP